jgi:hypothetical protein
MVTMDNQQRKTEVSELELGWLCGLFDGEGYVGGHWQNKGHYTPTLSISNTENTVLDKLISILDALGLPFYIYWQPRKSDYGVKQLWQVKAGGMKRVMRWLAVIGPHLVGKKEQADLLLAYCQGRLVRPLCQAIREDEKQLLIKMQQLKHQSNKVSEPVRSTTARRAPVTTGDGTV